MSDINFTVKKNLSCWNCDHFQRFDKRDEIENIYGECRRIAQLGKLENDPTADVYEFYWPVIDKSTTYWCGHWEPTQENQLPEVPEEPCDFEWPEDYLTWKPWNKKDPENVRCWNCDHFQRQIENLEPPFPLRPDFGECRRNQPIPAMFWREGNTEYQGFVKKLRGLYWCGQWERALHEVPPYPEQDEDPVIPRALEKKVKTAAKKQAKKKTGK